MRRRLQAPVGLGVFVGAAGIAWVLRWDAQALAARLALEALRPSLPFEQKQEPTESAASRAEWAQPGRVATDRQWNHDLFTAPTLYRDPVTGALSVVPPSPQPAVMELELIAVEAVPPAPRLVGWVGEDPGIWGVFVDPTTGATRLGQRGTAWTDQGYVVEQLSVDAAPGADVAVARLRDLRSGREILLSSGQPSSLPKWEARLRSTVDGTLHQAGPGTDIQLGMVRLRVAMIEPDPPSVLIERQEPGGVAHRHRLYPVASYAITP